jgi:hypothetical protein
MTPAKPQAISFLRTRQLGIVWVLAVLIGAICISSNPSTNPQRLVIPVVIMLVYSIVVYNRSADLFSTASQAYKSSVVAQLADSMYFMGFVWTLWALIDSFVIHRIETSDAIFRAFGYALVTTAAGMFSRLAILQFKYTATEQSQEAQTSVEDVLRQFTAALDTTRHVLYHWHTGLASATKNISMADNVLNQSIEHLQTDLRKTITTATTDYLNMLATTQALLEQAVTQTPTDLKSTLQRAIAGGLEDFGQQTANNLDQIRQATTGLVATLKRTNTSLGKSIDDLTQKITDVNEHVTTAENTITKATQVLNTTANVMSTTITTGATTFKASMQETSAALTTATQEVTKSMTGLSEEIKRELTLGLNGITITPHVPVTIGDDILDTAITPIRDDLRAIGQQATKIQETLNGHALSTQPSANAVAQHVERTFQAGIASINGRLQRIEEEVQSLKHRPAEAERSRWIFWPFGRR